MDAAERIKWGNYGRNGHRRVHRRQDRHLFLSGEERVDASPKCDVVCSREPGKRGKPKLRHEVNSADVTSESSQTDPGRREDLYFVT
jgi:hypothetical protein